MTPAMHSLPRDEANAARGWRGTAVLNRGFRPFFLAAGAWAVAAIALWPPFFRRRPETGESGLGFYQHRLFGGFLSSRPASISW